MQSNKPKAEETQQRYSIVTYLVLLFAVVIALVLLSYFVQLRRDNSDMASFRSEHLTRMEDVEAQIDDLSSRLDAIGNSLATIVAAQNDKNNELTAQSRDVLRRVEELETQAETMQSELDEIRGEMEELEKTGN